MSTRFRWTLPPACSLYSLHETTGLLGHTLVDSGGGLWILPVPTFWKKENKMSSFGCVEVLSLTVTHLLCSCFQWFLTENGEKKDLNWCRLLYKVSKQRPALFSTSASLFLFTQEPISEPALPPGLNPKSGIHWSILLSHTVPLIILISTGLDCFIHLIFTMWLRLFPLLL